MPFKKKTCILGRNRRILSIGELSGKDLVVSEKPTAWSVSDTHSGPFVVVACELAYF